MPLAAFTTSVEALLAPSLNMEKIGQGPQGMPLSPRLNAASSLGSKPRNNSSNKDVVLASATVIDASTSTSAAQQPKAAEAVPVAEDGRVSSAPGAVSTSPSSARPSVSRPSRLRHVTSAGTEVDAEPSADIQGERAEPNDTMLRASMYVVGGIGFEGIRGRHVG